MVRDIRDSKCKFQTPFHQVRDVRKLVKSSYRFVALENSSCSSGMASTAFREESKPVNRGPDKKPFPTPMVIKCQSVNTNNATKHSELVNTGENISETERLSPNLSEWPTRSETLHAAPRVPCAKQLVIEQPEFSLKIDAKAAKQKPEKAAEGSEKKPESKVSNQIALEKLKAAVKTMEQLYFLIGTNGNAKRKLRDQSRTVTFCRSSRERSKESRPKRTLRTNMGKWTLCSCMLKSRPQPRVQVLTRIKHVCQQVLTGRKTRRC